MSKITIVDSNFLITDEANIREAMEAMTDNQRGSVVVVDNKNHLLGVISDGDIRRAFLKGATLFTPVQDVVNMHPRSILYGPKSDKEAEKILSEDLSVMIIPVVDSKNVVVDIAVRNPEVRKEL